jgi:hypothetical protein
MVAIIRAFRSAQKIVMVHSPRHPTFMGVARPFTPTPGPRFRILLRRVRFVVDVRAASSARNRTFCGGCCPGYPGEERVGSERVTELWRRHHDHHQHPALQQRHLCRHR